MPRSIGATNVPGWTVRTVPPCPGTVAAPPGGSVAPAFSVKMLEAMRTGTFGAVFKNTMPATRRLIGPVCFSRKGSITV
jgi:hypothetical protein